MTGVTLKESMVRSVTIEWTVNGAMQYVTLTEWGNKEGVDFQSHNLAPIQLTNQQLFALINSATKLFIGQNIHN